jgi:hypothetical protein
LPSAPAWLALAHRKLAITGLGAMQLGRRALRQSIVASQAIDLVWTEMMTGSPANPIMATDIGPRLSFSSRSGLYELKWFFPKPQLRLENSQKTAIYLSYQQGTAENCL